MARFHALRSWRTLLVIAAIVPLAAIALHQRTRARASTPLLIAADVAAPPATADAPPTGILHPVHVNRPDGPPALATDQLDMHGNAVTINCSTCHSIKEPNFANRATADLDEFHQGLTVDHGSLTCLSCHNPDNYDTLRLADSSSLEYTRVMTLCGQCHGPQLRDYNHGVHGGMTGYWDRTRGPQHRNNCIDCHDPHAPAFPMMQPTFKPVDRFLNPQHHDEHAAND